MQLAFKNGEIFEWVADDGPSLNGGGNNPGWVVFAPFDWEIDYAKSFVVTNDTGNVNFNVSGFSKGAPNDEEEHVCVFDQADYNKGNGKPFAYCECGESIELEYNGYILDSFSRVPNGNRNTLNITISEIWGDFVFSFTDSIVIPNNTNEVTFYQISDSCTWISVFGNINTSGFQLNYHYIPVE